jgi:4-amino-4-deoxy-L-arabinose transferase-like glycosyltransferase
MSRFIYYLACLANVILLGFALFLFGTSFGEERFLALLIALVPILSLAALWAGPDIEERRLQKQLNKARMRAELAELEKGKTKR